LRDEDRVASILQSVVAACAPLGVPVTLKTRTGWDRASRNAVRVARLAEDIGVSAITLHGRTRCDLYQGDAEYDTIRDVKQAVKIPVIANGDIDSPEKARYVLEYTGADAVMVGRAAQGRPWIFREISHYLQTGSHLQPPTYGELRDCLLDHLEEHYRFYGEFTGVRSARKHIGWYLADMPDAGEFLPRIHQISSTRDQTVALEQWFDRHPPNEPIMARAGQAQDPARQETTAKDHE
jgi:tRNA-dihydrouridine synthase B